MSLETVHLAKSVEYVVNPCTIREIEHPKVASLQVLSLKKLCMSSSRQDPYDYFKKFPPTKGDFILLEKIKHELESVSPHLKVSTNSEFNTLTLQSDGALHSLEKLNISNPSCGISDENTLYCSDVQKNNLYEKFGGLYCGLEGEAGKARGDLDIGNDFSISKTIRSSELSYCVDTSSFNVQNVSEVSDKVNLLKRPHKHDRGIPILFRNDSFSRETFNCFLSCSKVLEDNCSKPCDEVYDSGKDKAGKLKPILRSYDSHSCIDESNKCISLRSIAQKENFSEESVKAYSPLKEEIDERERPLNLSFSQPAFCCGTEIASKSFISSLERSSQKSKESVQMNLQTEEANDFPGKEYTQAKMRPSVENSEESDCCFYKIDWIKTEHSPNQFFLSKATTDSLIQRSGEELPKGGDSKDQIEYSKDFAQKSVIEAEHLKCDDSKMQNDYLKESNRSNYSTEGETYLQLSDESEFRQHPQAYLPDGEKDFSKSEYSKMKIDSTEIQSLLDDSLIEMPSCVFDTLLETNENTSFESCSVGSVQILIDYLYRVEKDLKFKEDETNRLKQDFETGVKILNSSDLKNIKDSKELLKTANNLVSSCDILLASLVKDRVECEWYLENLQNISVFQENCVFNKSATSSKTVKSY